MILLERKPGSVRGKRSLDGDVVISLLDEHSNSLMLGGSTCGKHTKPLFAGFRTPKIPLRKVLRKSAPRRNCLCKARSKPRSISTSFKFEASSQNSKEAGVRADSYHTIVSWAGHVNRFELPRYYAELPRYYANLR